MRSRKRLAQLCRIAGSTMILVLVSTWAVQAAETYVLNKGHTDIRFGWDHAGVSVQSGRFNAFDGELVLDEKDISKSTLSVTIKADSLSTGVKALDDDLKSANFFEVSKYPEITFKSTSVKQTGKSSAFVTGDLTIRGITRPVTLDVELIHKGEHPIGQFIAFYKGKWLGFRAKTTLLRSDFGVDKYAPLVSDRISLQINTELKAK